MKKNIIILITILLVIFFAIYGFLIEKRSETNVVKKQNKYYQNYLNKQIYGTDVATIINKAIDQNEQNKVEKDKNNLYIDNRKKLN